MIMKLLNMISEMFTSDDIDDEEYDEIVDSLNNRKCSTCRHSKNHTDLHDNIVDGIRYCNKLHTVVKNNNTCNFYSLNYKLVDDEVENVRLKKLREQANIREMEED